MSANVWSTMCSKKNYWARLLLVTTTYGDKKFNKLCSSEMATKGAEKGMSREHSWYFYIPGRFLILYIAA